MKEPSIIIGYTNQYKYIVTCEYKEDYPEHKTTHFQIFEPIFKTDTFDSLVSDDRIYNNETCKNDWSELTITL